jgi:hypothetical protein
MHETDMIIAKYSFSYCESKRRGAGDSWTHNANSPDQVWSGLIDVKRFAILLEV